MYKDITSGSSKFVKDKDKPSIFGEVLNSKLPTEDKECRRIVDEGQAVIAGGVITTAWASSHFVFHVVSNPKVYQRLQDELRAAWPDPSIQLNIFALEKLPYLRGCIQEALRLSYGITHRQTRVHQDRSLRYKDWVIPPGTPIGMTIMDVHHDESIFPNSEAFIPERWIDGGKSPKGVSLDHYLLAFGKGTRSCVGVKFVLQSCATRDRADKVI